jgi:hypothetical protein
VFHIDITICADCGNRRRCIADITETALIRKILRTETLTPTRVRRSPLARAGNCPATTTNVSFINRGYRSAIAFGNACAE